MSIIKNEITGDIEKMCFGGPDMAGCFKLRPIAEFAKLSEHSTTQQNKGYGHTCIVCRTMRDVKSAREKYERLVIEYEKMRITRGQESAK